MTRLYNFAAGPAGLPEEILEHVRDEFLDWQNTGLSIVEIGHRTEKFKALLEKAEYDLRRILNISPEYHVLFLAGPARAQFANIPFNLLGKNPIADYLDSGVWSHMAFEEAQKYGSIYCAAECRSQHYLTIPPESTWECHPDAAYFYYTDNETIDGLALYAVPNVGDVPIVCDMTSSLLTRPIDVSKYGVIFAGVQKNIAAAGLTIVIIRNDLLEQAMPMTPSVVNFANLAKAQSLLYTNNTFSIYMASLMFEWVERKGGISALYAINQRKSEKVYRYLDNTGFYITEVDPRYRSMLNIPFKLQNENLRDKFLQESLSHSIWGLDGHAVKGGFRASFYNAVTEKSVDVLIDFMKDFENRHG